MTFEEELNKVRKGIFSCIADFCEGCPYFDCADCGQQIMLDAERVIRCFEYENAVLIALNAELRSKQKED